MNHTKIINLLIHKYWFKSYLEIGVQTAEQNYDRIDLDSDSKVGVDPCLIMKDNLLSVTSDVFFAHQTDKFDIIFLDGLHHSDQVERDFNNSIRCLNDNGVVLIHDTCPDEEQYTTVPRQTKRWYGNVFSFALNLGRYTGINFLTLDIDCGITIVWKTGAASPPLLPAYQFSWAQYLEMKVQLLNVVPLDGFEKLLP